MKLKFKVQTASLDKQASKREDPPLASRLTFVNVNCPMQIKSASTQRKIRSHVMTEIGRSRRRKNGVRSPSRGRSVTVASTSVPRSIPSYWGEVRVCINYERLFRAMDMVSDGLLTLAMADSAHKFRENLDRKLADTLQHNPQSEQAWSLSEMEQYTESLSLVRKSIVAPDSRASCYAIIGTIICLAVFDVRRLYSCDRQFGLVLTRADACPESRKMGDAHEGVGKSRSARWWGAGTRLVCTRATVVVHVRIHLSLTLLLGHLF